jgi:hypothetical protein
MPSPNIHPSKYFWSANLLFNKRFHLALMTRAPKRLLVDEPARPGPAVSTVFDDRSDRLHRGRREPSMAEPQLLTRRTRAHTLNLSSVRAALWLSGTVFLALLGSWRCWFFTSSVSTRARPQFSVATATFTNSCMMPGTCWAFRATESQQSCGRRNRVAPQPMSANLPRAAVIVVNDRTGPARQQANGVPSRSRRRWTINHRAHSS